MLEIYRTPEATNDLALIAYHIGMTNSWSVSFNYLEKIDMMFFTLADSPGIGKTRSEIKPGLRSIPCQSHIVYYEISETQLRIVRVLHAAQNQFEEMNQE